MWTKLTLVVFLGIIHLRPILAEETPAKVLPSPTAETETTTETPTTSVANNNNTDDDPSSKPPESPPSARVPRGTVYQIRPVPDGFVSPAANPFHPIDAVTDFKFPDLKSIISAESETLSASPTTRFFYTDSEPDEPISLPKFVLSPSPTPPVPLALEQFEDNFQEPEEETEKRPERRKARVIKLSALPTAGDASYAFGYSLDDQTRHEVADPGGNVRGYYQYVDDEGYVRKVVYTAGPGQGFVVLNKERVKGPGVVKIPRKQIQNLNSIPGQDSSLSPSNNQFATPKPRNFIEEVQQYPPFSGGGRPNSRRKKPVYVIKIRKPQRKSKDEDAAKELPLALLPDYIPTSSFMRRSGFKIANVASVPASETIPLVRKYTEISPTMPEPRASGVFTGEIPSDDSQLIYIVGEDEEDDGSYREDPSQDNGQWDGDTGDGPVVFINRKKPQLGPLPDPSYSFGYETEDSNRLEKADNFGNVRGSYSYIDSDGVKRTVHYIAGSTTGFQVLGASPSSARSVRIEAPPGFIVTRRRKAPIALTTSESEYPGFPPSQVVYHVVADSSWNPWELFSQGGGSSRVSAGRIPRRKIMRVMRRKLRKFPPDFQASPVDIGSSSTARAVEVELSASEAETTPSSSRNSLGEPSPKSPSLKPSEEISSSPRTYIVRSRRPRPFRHSTRVNIDPNKVVFIRRRRPSHRAYTRNVDPRDSEEQDENNFKNDPIYFSPAYVALSERVPRPIPNPIILRPSQVTIRNRGSGSSGFDTAASNFYPVRTPEDSPSSTTSDFNNVIPTSSPEVSSTTRVYSQSLSTSTSMDLSVRSSTTRIPVTVDSHAQSESTAKTVTLDAPPTTQFPFPTDYFQFRRRGDSRSGRGGETSSSVTTPSSTVVRMVRDHSAALQQHEETTMSSSLRLMKRLNKKAMP